MQVILGAGGAIGRALAGRLPTFTTGVRLVSRTPTRVNDHDELVVANLLDGSATADAVQGATVAYLLAGLPYETPLWREQWPRVMRHAIDACARHDCALVFLDNVYAYGRVDGSMTESTPYNPCSGKGEVRAQIASMLTDAIAAGEVRGMIVRAADFYGPGAALSVATATVFARLAAGRTPQWLANARAIHTFSYTLDVAESLARLGNRPDAYGQVWHALTSREPVTGEDFVRLACELAGRPYRLQVAPRWLLRLLGLAMPVIRESGEMLYQFERDYVLESTKAERALGLAATTYREGIAATLRQ